MSTEMIKSYFKQELINAGFPDDLDIEFSLNYCQGDGMAMYGRFDESEIRVMAERLLNKGMFSFFKGYLNAADVEIELYRNDHGHRYSHHNTMNVCENIMEPSDFDDPDDCPVSIAQHHAAATFVERLESYVVETSQRLESEGYAICESTPFEEEEIWSFKTENYEFVVLKCPDDIFDPYADWDDPHDAVKSLAEGDTQYFALKSIIYSLDECGEREDELAESGVHGFHFDAEKGSDAEISKIRRDILNEGKSLLSEVIFHYRNELKEQSYPLAA